MPRDLRIWQFCHFRRSYLNIDVIIFGYIIVLNRIRKKRIGILD